jgi:hypothetical protein
MCEENKYRKKKDCGCKKPSSVHISFGINYLHQIDAAKTKPLAEPAFGPTQGKTDGVCSCCMQPKEIDIFTRLCSECASSGRCG